jgi:hypothetical protein
MKAARPLMFFQRVVDYLKCILQRPKSRMVDGDETLA